MTKKCEGECYCTGACLSDKPKSFSDLWKSLTKKQREDLMNQVAIQAIEKQNEIIEREKKGDRSRS